MEYLRKLKTKTKIIYLIIIFSVASMYFSTYANWYEEIEVYETENIDKKWWLSRKKKEELKKEQEEEINRKKEENKNKKFKDKKIKWLYEDTDLTSYPKDKCEIIDDDNDGIGYNYYFDKDGYLLTDTITNDYKIVDEKGREVDYNFAPIKYKMDELKKENEGIVVETLDSYKAPTKEPSKVLLQKGVVLKQKEKLYDSNINKKVIDYVSSSNRFIKETKGTIYNEIRWKKCSSLKGNGGYVIFDNPKNNFNKMNGYIATQYNTFDNDNTICTLKVYDADLYDKYDNAHCLDELEELYINNKFNNADAVKFDFTFDKSTKRLRFEIETSGDYSSRTCYLKDLKYGFSKLAFKEELTRKQEEQDNIKELKRLGIYVEDILSLDTYEEESGIEEYKEETENENNDDRIGGIPYVSDEETTSYEDIVRDRNTGPYFDEDLKNAKEVGPGL